MSPVDQKLTDAAISFCEARGWEFGGHTGGGAFKAVFKAFTETGDAVALKLLKDRSPRTTREVDALRRCTHPNIARLVADGAFQFEGDIVDFAIEEFLAGGTLAERITRGRPNLAETISIGQVLIQALSHIKSLNIVHRDIKPANVMFRGDGITPVLVDFGLVRDLTRSSLTHTWLAMGPGTPLFAPPEQLNNDKEMIDWRSDQFSLGVTLSLGHLAIHPYQYPGEQEITSVVVERVATRSSPRRDFVDICTAAGLPGLPRMVSPWPVRRYRTPEELFSAWSN